MHHYKDRANISKLLEEYQKRNPTHSRPKGEILEFDLPRSDNKEELTIYNPTKPIEKDGKRFILGRVEPLDSEDSKVMFFVEENNKWKVYSHPIFNLQDPFYNKNIRGYQILGGVRTYIDPNSPDLGYETVFYKYRECATELIDSAGRLAEPFCVGPKKMKDIRLIELSSGKIGVFTRPQGGEAGLGKIAYIEIDTLDELEKAIPQAKIIPGLFYGEEWGGANELYLLKNGNIGVLGHIAHFEGNLRHYYAISFTFDRKLFEAFNVEILATAEEFPEVKSKNELLGKILFSGGLVRKDNGKAELYVGVGDTKVGRIHITDPFLEAELVN